MTKHLTLDTLAELVEEAPTPVQADHLATCRSCAAELEELRRQTEALGALPELRPPLDDWDVLEARLRSEGLVRDPGLLDRLALVRTPVWMRAAAAVLLFVGGTALGAGLSAPGSLVPTLADGSADALRAGSVEEAVADLQRAEDRYVTALTRYRSLLTEDGGTASEADPASRFAALEYLVAASQAAVRQAPSDPFLNGLLASTMAERDAVLTSFASDQDDWF